MSSDIDLMEEEFDDEVEIEESNKKESTEISKKGLTFMTKTVMFSIGIIIIYTVWTQIAAIVWHIEPNDTLTEWIYKFFGLEMALMCFKKVMDKRLKSKEKKK